MQVTNGVGESYPIVEEDVAWACPNGERLLARIFRPATDGSGAWPMIVNVHGGAWNIGDRTVSEVYCRALARTGVVVASIDFRQGPAHQHPAASIDVLNAMRWAHLHCERLGGSPRSIGLIGSSSGGHLALLASVRPNGAEYRAVPPLIDRDGAERVRDDIDPTVAYVIALWPVSDPFFRYRYARRAGLKALATYSEAYYSSEDAMRAASVQRVVTAGEATQLPPALVVQPGEDSNVPIEMTFDLLRAWQSRGGHIEYAYFPDMPHGFGQRPSPETDDMVALARDFISRHGPR